MLRKDLGPLTHIVKTWCWWEYIHWVSKRIKMVILSIYSFRWEIEGQNMLNWWSSIILLDRQRMLISETRIRCGRLTLAAGERTPGSLKYVQWKHCSVQCNSLCVQCTTSSSSVLLYRLVRQFLQKVSCSTFISKTSIELISYELHYKMDLPSTFRTNWPKSFFLSRKCNGSINTCFFACFSIYYTKFN